MARNLRQFFVPAEAIHGDEVRITGADALHIRRVLRLRAGDRIIAVAPDRTAWIVELTSIAKHEVAGRLSERAPQSELAASPLSLAQGITRPQTMDLVIQKSVELGAGFVAPVICERTQASYVRDAPKRLQRWQRIAEEAAKQCRRPDVPEIAAPRLLPDLLTEWTALEARKFMLYEHATLGLPIAAIAPMTQGQTAAPCLVLIGPEGGFTEVEAELAAQAGFSAFCLGPLILRSETAAIVALGLVRFLRGDLE